VNERVSDRVAEHYLLGADVGGTRATFALAAQGQLPRIAVQHAYPSQDFTSLGDIVADFVSRPEVAKHHGAISGACFSVAGPVANNAVKLTNLGWLTDGAALARDFKLPGVMLINDFSAAAMGIAALGPSDIDTLQAGREVAGGTRLVVGAGTGLGVGLLTWREKGYDAHPSEGGHADFAPVDEMQDRLLAHLRRSFGHVSYERVVSGPGLMRIFSFLQDAGVGVPSKALLDASNKHSDAAELIAEFALSKLDPLAVRALDLFVAVYGAFTGNMAVTTLARGGVFIAGGIAPKIAAKLKEGAFMRAFVSKGRYSELLAAMPVHVVMNPQVGLLGALYQAARLAR
jgi:glucokinase